MDPFTNNLKLIKNVFNVEISLIIPQFEEFTREPVTLGDYLRRRRLELGLYQKDVAVQIGVTASTIWNWEHGWTVDRRYTPRIITFLGYHPFSPSGELGNKSGEP